MTASPSRYRVEINGLRAFAVIAVIINHFSKNILPSGYLGVDIFFVISGFVITSSLFDRGGEKLGVFLSEFYSKRIKRIYPALLVFVLVISFLTYLFDPETKQNLRLGITSLLGISNIYIFQQQSDYFGPAQELNPLLHSWSLGVEEQFYLIFPFLIWFSGFNRKKKNRQRNLFVIMLIMATASLTSYAYLYNVNFPAAYFLTSSRVWEIALGSICFILTKNDSKFQKLVRNIPSIYCLLAIVLILFLPIELGRTATILTAFATTILLACIDEHDYTYKLLSHPKVVYIGSISYSLYLWHWGVLAISRMTIGIHWWSVPAQAFLIYILAIGSYKYIETPLRYSKFTSNVRIFGLWILTFILAFASLIGFSKISKNIFLGKVPLKRTTESSEYWDGETCSRGFKSSRKMKIINFNDCWILTSKEINENNKDNTIVYIYGNSYNTQLIPAFKELIEMKDSKVNYRINAVSCSGIPSLEILRQANLNNPCRENFRQYLSWILKDSDENRILIINTSMKFFSGTDILVDKKTMKIISPSKASDIYAKELNKLGLQAKTKNVQLYITSGIPYLLTNPASCGNWFNSLNQKPCNSLDPNSKKFQLEPYNSILNATSENVYGIDIYTPLERKFSSVNNVYLYFSSRDHISQRGASLLTELLKNKTQ